MDLDYPNHCIRGIEDKNDIRSDDFVKLTLYLPDVRTAKNRTDGGMETSINWEDNNNVLEFTLKFWNHDKNRLAFPHGAVRLPTEEIDRINANPATQNSLYYERAVVDGNSYHGNLVFSSDMPQVQQNLIAAVLATYSSKIFRSSD